MKTRTLTRRLRHVAILGAGLIMTALIPGTASALITGSGHDLTASAALGSQICIFCHTPHNANTTETSAPLWNRATNAATYTPYGDPAGTMNATAGSPTGVSKLCMSCHDGLVAVDAYGGAVGTTTIDAVGSGAGDFGVDLSNDHPISFVYDDALATADGELWAPTTATVRLGGETTSGTIDTLMLFGGTPGSKSVECASCHDVHNTDISSEDYKMLRDKMLGSELCLNCHNK